MKTVGIVKDGKVHIMFDRGLKKNWFYTQRKNHENTFSLNCNLTAVIWEKPGKKRPLLSTQCLFASHTLSNLTHSS